MARKKNPLKKLAHPKKTNNMTGNRTPGRHGILALPRLRLYPLTRSSEVLTSGIPTLLKVKTEKKKLIEIDLTHSQLKKTLLYVRFPNLLQVRGLRCWCRCIYWLDSIDTLGAGNGLSFNFLVPLPLPFRLNRHFSCW